MLEVRGFVEGMGKQQRAKNNINCRLFSPPGIATVQSATM